jgi:hypothetical protein
MRRELEFEETFRSDALDLDRWLPYYLPHWSSRSRKTVDQSRAYSMQLMLSFYEFRPAANDDAGAYPKEFVVDYVPEYRFTS